MKKVLNFLYFMIILAVAVFAYVNTATIPVDYVYQGSKEIVISYNENIIANKDVINKLDEISEVNGVELFYIDLDFSNGKYEQTFYVSSNSKILASFGNKNLTPNVNYSTSLEKQKSGYTPLNIPIIEFETTIRNLKNADNFDFNTSILVKGDDESRQQFIKDISAGNINVEPEGGINTMGISDIEEIILLIMFILIIAMIINNIYISKNNAIYKLNGFDLKRIIYIDNKKLLVKLLKIIGLIYGFIIIALIIKNVNLIPILLIRTIPIFTKILIFILVINSLINVFLQRKNSHQIIKGNIDYNLINIIMNIFKVVSISIIMLLISSTINETKEYLISESIITSQVEKMENKAKMVALYGHYNESNFGDDRITSLQMYLELNKHFDVIAFSAMNNIAGVGLIPQEEEYMANEKYFNENKVITVDNNDVSKELNGYDYYILLPEKLRDKKYLFNFYVRNTNQKIFDEQFSTKDYVKTIYYKDDCEFYTYSDEYKIDNGYLINPVVVVVDEDVITSPQLQDYLLDIQFETLTSNNEFIFNTESKFPYEDVKPIINSLSNEEIYRDCLLVTTSFTNQLLEYKNIIAKNIILIMFLLVIIFNFSKFFIEILITQNLKKISICIFHGYTYHRILKYIYLKTLIIYCVLLLICLLLQVDIGLLLVMYLIENIFIFYYGPLVINKVLLKSIKGGV